MVRQRISRGGAIAPPPSGRRWYSPEGVKGENREGRQPRWYGPEGTKAAGIAFAPPPPGLKWYSPKGAKGMTMGVAVTHDHHPRLG